MVFALTFVFDVYFQVAVTFVIELVFNEFCFKVKVTLRIELCILSKNISKQIR